MLIFPVCHPKDTVWQGPCLFLYGHWPLSSIVSSSQQTPKIYWMNENKNKIGMIQGALLLCVTIYIHTFVMLIFVSMY